MENFSFKQPDPSNPNKQYFQLPTRKTTIQPSQEQGAGGHLDMFKAYSSSNCNSNTSGLTPGYTGTNYNKSAPLNNQQWQNKPQETGYLQVNQ